MNPCVSLVESATGATSARALPHRRTAHRRQRLASAGAALATVCGLASVAATQEIDIARRDWDGGFMWPKRSFNATRFTVMPEVDCNGEQEACALTSAIWHKGRFWLLGREGWCCGRTPEASAKTFIHEWTADATYIRTHEIPLPVDLEDENGLSGTDSPPGTAPEVRDMAADDWRYDQASMRWVQTGGQAVFLGTEEGIYVTRVEVQGSTGDWHLWDQIETESGTKTVAAGDFVNPIRGPGLAALRAHGTPELPALDPATGAPLADTVNGEGEGYMALAFDPGGNGGHGSFWVGADDGSVLGGDGLVRVGDPRGFDDPRNPSSQRYAVGGPGTSPARGDTRSWDGHSGGNVKPILEIDLHGNILTTLHNGTLVTDISDPLYTHWDPDGTKTSGNLGDDGFLSTGGEWTAGGLELDPLTGNLWVQMNMDRQLFELDITTGDATGFVHEPAYPDPDRAGGVTGIPNGDPDPYYPVGGFFDLAVLVSRSGDDFFSVHRGHLYPELNGLTEPRLKASVAPLAPKTLTSPLPYHSQDTVHLLLDETGQGSAAPSQRADAGQFPAAVVFDINNATDTGIFTDLSPLGFPGIMPELWVHSFFSAPDPANTGIPLGIVPYLYTFWIPAGGEVSLSMPQHVPTGQRLRMQAIYYDSRSLYTPGLMVTNELWLAGVGTNELLIELVGEDPARISPGGFFRIHYLGGAGIDTVQLDFRRSNNLDLLDAWFDVEQQGMGDRMAAGRGWDPVSQTLVNLPGCDGTWRQDSDLTTGLVYAPTYDYPEPLDGNNPVPQYVSPAVNGAPSCDFYTSELGFEIRSGFSSFGLMSRENTTSDLIFQFDDFDDPGDVLRFDCDTDGVSPVGAEGHASMVVNVFQADGRVRSGELLLDPSGGRAFLGW